MGTGCGRFPQLTRSWPPSSLAQCCPGCGPQSSPGVRGQAHPASACWVALGRVLLLSGSGFPICGGRSLGPAASWPSPGLPSVPQTLHQSGKRWALLWAGVRERPGCMRGGHRPLTFQVCAQLCVFVDYTCVRGQRAWRGVSRAVGEGSTAVCPSAGRHTHCVSTAACGPGLNGPGCPSGAGRAYVWGQACPKGPQGGPLPPPAPIPVPQELQSRAFISAISPLHSLFKLHNFCLIVMAYFKITRNQSREGDTAAFIALLR